MTPATGSAPASTVARTEGRSIDLGAGPCLAIDIGGTKIDVGIVTQDGEILDRLVVPTDRSLSADLLLGSILSAADHLAVRTSIAPVACGVGCGGPMESGGASVSPLNIPAWRSFPLHGRLVGALRMPVTVDNDAKALALGEGWLGAAKQSRNYLAMVVSTGIGGGIVLDGRLLDGAKSNAGHIGHLVVEPGGRRCACGVRGCLEAEASGTAIRALTGRPAADASPSDIDRCGEMVGRAVASVVTLLDLELCVVAGSVALGFGARFFDAANRSMRSVLGLDYTAGAEIRPAGLGSDGPLLGAARVGLLGGATTVDS